MDIRFEKNDVLFVWNDRKAAGNPRKHEGVTFEQATEAFFDPFFKLVDAGRNDQARDAINNRFRCIGAFVVCGAC